ncbi:hypothetical protein SAMN04487897_11893 [Paenibacillus sp. yr247]|nr:hypothetical protein SAMN04487897_11893 [Paenibacillus sp. yr247]
MNRVAFFVWIKDDTPPHFIHVEVLPMRKADKLTIDQAELVHEWMTVLPTTLQPTDQARVWADEADPQALRVHIMAAGHTGYTIDFKVTYVDSREVKVELTDVQKGTQHIEETSDLMQNLVEDYIRHIHECAQALQKVTHA